MRRGEGREGREEREGREGREGRATGEGSEAAATSGIGELLKLFEAGASTAYVQTAAGLNSSSTRSRLCEIAATLKPMRLQVASARKLLELQRENALNPAQVLPTPLPRCNHDALTMTL